MPCILCLLASLGGGAAQADVVLVRQGEPRARLVVTEKAPPPERFAAEELQRYIERISGARLPIVSQAPRRGPAIFLGRGYWSGGASSNDAWDDSFRIGVKGQKVFVAGNTPRGTLFAAYALLERLGCRWFAPNFAFYPGGKGEWTPEAGTLSLPDQEVVERPASRYRAKYVEEGRTHTPENLPALIDWMAKTRHNVFSCPLDYGGRGRVRWDTFREKLAPELKKRGLLLEVGGHGYQNFLPVGQYFAEHPEWFGADDRGERSRAASRVFETSNPQALAELTRNVISYLRARPEIDIFDLWPPDGARWSESPEALALGPPPVRHALVVKHVAEALARERPEVTLEFIAYQNYLTPPPGISFPANTLVGFCPIGRSFTTSIADGDNPVNKGYWDALMEWKAREDTRGRLYIYSYFRKYAWRSLPVLTPQLIGGDVAKYRNAGAIGISSYSEPDDWLTYEIQHLALARAAWDERFDAREWVASYSRDRFAAAGEPMRRFFELVEASVPQAAHVPGTPPPSPQTLTRCRADLDEARAALAEGRRLLASDPDRRTLLDRLGVALEYARLDVARRAEPRQDEALRKQVEALVRAHSGQGLFVSPESIVERFLPRPPRVRR